MIAPGLYLLIWLLILGSAVVYAADSFLEVKVCSRGGEHRMEGKSMWVRKTSIIAYTDDHGSVKGNVCTTIYAIGRTFFIDGSVAQLEKKLGEK